MSKIINLNLMRRGNTTKWEWIARRLVVLATYGYNMNFEPYIDDPDFMSDDFLKEYYGSALPEYMQEELDKIKM